MSALRVGADGQRWFHFLTQPAKMDSPMQRMIHNEEAETGSAEFKAKLALEAIKAHQMVAELTSRHELHPTQIAAWKREAVEKLAQVFDDKGGSSARRSGIRQAHSRLSARPKIRAHGANGRKSVAMLTLELARFDS